jgi:hypothetical protein
MKRKSNLTCPAVRQRKGERGAALISTLLLSILLLTAGGALLMSTGMSANNAFDSTAEMQAYYVAESGMQATLVVFRNVTPKVTFVSAVTPSKSNVTGDAATTTGIARLSNWLTYGSTAANSRVTVGNGAYAVSITDPDNTSPVKPNRLLLTVTGYGPRGAVKQLTAIVTAGLFTFVPPATITIRGADNGTAMTPCSDSQLQGCFGLGDSNKKVYSGQDNANSSTVLPAFAVTNADTRALANSIAGGVDASSLPIGVMPIDISLNPGASGANTPPSPPVTPAPATGLTTPPFLQSVDSTRALVATLRDVALSQNRIFPSYNGAAGSIAAPVITFVDGNATITGGGGILVVTGNLLLHENYGFSGLILVLGNGVITREGGGPSTFLGAIVVARFNATGGFLAPTYSTQPDQGNIVTMQYDSGVVQDSLALTGLRVLGIAEK